VKVGDLVRWLDPWKVKRLGMILDRADSAPCGDGYYDVLVDGKTEFCHESNMELISESR